MENNKTFIQKLIEMQEYIYSLNIKSDTKVQFSKTKFEYLSLPTMLKLVTEACRKCGLLFSQEYIIKDGTELIRTVIEDESNVKESHVIIDQGWDDIKDWGGFTTYKRRYAIMALVGIHQDKDENNAETSTMNKPYSPYINEKQVNLLKFRTNDKLEKRSQIIKQYGAIEKVPKEKMDSILEWIQKD